MNREEGFGFPASWNGQGVTGPSALKSGCKDDGAKLPAVSGKRGKSRKLQTEKFGPNVRKNFITRWRCSHQRGPEGGESLLKMEVFGTQLDKAPAEQI